MTTIQILDLGGKEYKLKCSSRILGNQYENGVNSISVVKPDAESENICTMIVSYGNKTIDLISVGDEEILISSNISQFEYVRIAFAFTNDDGYVKNSESVLFDFLPAEKPANFVAEFPEIEQNYITLYEYAFTDCENEDGTLTFKNYDGDTVDTVTGLAMQSALEESVTDLQSQITTNADNISTETSERESADEALQEQITSNDDDIAKLQSADETLQTNIDTEATARASADTTLQDGLDAEAAARSSADSTLQTNIDNEAASRESADSTLQTNIDSEASSRAASDTTLQTNIDNVQLASGASITLSIDTTTYVMTLKLLNSVGTTLSTQTIDFPLESMVVGATYASGTLTLTLQNGTTLDIDISSIIDGLVSQADFDDLSAQVSTNTENIASNATNISTNTANISANASAISAESTARESADSTLQTNIDNEASVRSDADTDLQNQITSNDDDIAALQAAEITLQGNIDVEATTRANADTDLQSQITTNTGNIATNTSDISDLKTQVETNTSDIKQLTEGVSLTELQTSVDTLTLESGATLALSIDESTYVMTVQLKNSSGTVLSTGTVDLPLETMVVSASYTDGKLYLTLNNGTQLDGIDISDIVSGLASQTDLDAFIDISAGRIVTSSSGNVGEIFNDYTHNVATGITSHAEGYATTASGHYSHAEGSYTTASGSHSHAEGQETLASNPYSHAEGIKTTASGLYSHAEGYRTTACASSSHSGGYYTTADQDYQTAIGEYNLEGQTGSLFAVGNGSSDARSNAFEVFQDGHAEVNGDLQVSGNITDGTNSVAVEDIATLSTEQTITGAKTFSSSVRVGIGTLIQADSNGAMEFGRRDGTTATPYIDFHTDGLSTTDYNVRILASGTELRITAASGLVLNGGTITYDSSTDTFTI